MQASTPRSLAAVTALQGVVALALFAPGVLAPRLGLSVGDISLFATCVFAVGIAVTIAGGAVVARYGSFACATLPLSSRPAFCSASPSGRRRRRASPCSASA